MSKEAAAETKPKKKRSKVKTIVLIVVLVIVALFVAVVTISVVKSMPPKESRFQFIKVENGYEVKYEGSRSDLEDPDLQVTIKVPSEYNGMPVVGIAHGAFQAMQMVNTVVIPESVTYIDEYAFENCHKLTLVVIEGNGLKKVADRAFKECNSLKQLNLPDSVESIGKQAFSYCTKLEGFNLPQNVTKIEDEMFFNCMALKEVTGKGITSIGKAAFSFCSSLEYPARLELVEGATINDTAFDHCGALNDDPFFQLWLAQWK